MLPKDIYLYLSDFADDRTILNMLSVNKEFYTEHYFERLLQRRYPLLIKYKTNEETWKRFYIRVIHNLSLLQEKFDFPYIPNPDFESMDHLAKGFVNRQIP